MATSYHAADTVDVLATSDIVFWDAFELCGNRAIDSGEVCDRENLAGQTCATVGYTAGTLSCSRQCQLDKSQCTGSVCTVATCDTDTDCGAGVCGPCLSGFCLGHPTN
ncbi:MAG TPA: hypothetical protein VF132_10915 [Rudaea sp.]